MNTELIANLPAPARPKNLAEFIQKMKPFERHASPKLRIARVELAGKTGKWHENGWDEASRTYKDTEFQDFTDGTFIISPLLVTNFCKWKYEEGARENYVTTEFVSNAKNPIQLLKVSFGGPNGKSKQEVIATFADYQDFKRQNVMVDKVTGKPKSPYDYYVSVYAYHHLGKRVVKMEMRGSSRNSWFDFQREIFSSGEEIDVISQAKIRVGTGKDKMQTGEEFFFAKFSLEGRNPDDFMENEVIGASEELIAFLAMKQREKSQAQHSEDAVDAEIIAEPPQAVLHEAPQAAGPVQPTEAFAAAMPPKGNEIRLEDIPF